MLDLLIKNAVVITEKEEFFGCIGVRDERIVSLSTEEQEAARIIDARGQYAVPGGVDPHVHIRYPGGAHRETFWTGTCAAAAGGATTIVEHPISSPPQYSPEILKNRVDAFLEQGIVDAAFLGAAGGDHLDQIKRVATAGIVGFKTFLHEPPEGREKEFIGLCCSDNLQLFNALQRISQTGLLAAAHTEDNDLVSGRIKALRAEGKTFPRAHCLSRPPVVELMAVQRLLTLAREVGARTYLVHLSTPQAVELALEARAKGQEVYIETCPQYLYMDETWLDRFGAYAKCNPALRSPDLVQRMWTYVADGSADVVSSDHAPYTVAEKEKDPQDIFAAPAGFPGLETRGAFLFKAVKEGRLSLRRAVELISTNPARIFGLPRKGKIALGYDADIVLLNPYQDYTLQAEDLFTKAKDICHFMDGLILSGKPETVIRRGSVIFQNGAVLAQPGTGRWLRPVPKA